MDPEVRHTLLWLAERVAGPSIDRMLAESKGQTYGESICQTCGHARRDHAIGGDADNPSPWPCNFPQSRGGPTILCYCGDYQPLTEDSDE